MPSAQTSLAPTEASAVPTTLSSGAGRTASRNRWIQSAWFDGCFFLLSPLAGLVLVAGHLWLAPRASALLALAGFYFIGMPHYLSTLTFYFGDDSSTACVRWPSSSVHW
jgi:hypothetical protein